MEYSPESLRADSNSLLREIFSLFSCWRKLSFISLSLVNRSSFLALSLSSLSNLLKSALHFSSSSVLVFKLSSFLFRSWTSLSRALIFVLSTMVSWCEDRLSLSWVDSYLEMFLWAASSSCCNLSLSCWILSHISFHWALLSFIEFNSWWSFSRSCFRRPQSFSTSEFDCRSETSSFCRLSFSRWHAASSLFSVSKSCLNRWISASKSSFSSLSWYIVWSFLWISELSSSNFLWWSCHSNSLRFPSSDTLIKRLLASSNFSTRLCFSLTVRWSCCSTLLNRFSKTFMSRWTSAFSCLWRSILASNSPSRLCDERTSCCSCAFCCWQLS